MPTASFIDDPDGQIVLIPEGFDLPQGFCLDGEEAEAHWEDGRLVLTPVACTKD